MVDIIYKYDESGYVSYFRVSQSGYVYQIYNTLSDGWKERETVYREKKLIGAKLKIISEEEFLIETKL